MKLTNGQLKVLQEHIQEELRKRCFPCTVSIEETEERGKSKVNVSSTKFNTIPVIHSEIEIVDFGSSITDNEENKDLLDVYIHIHARYEGNGVDLFRVIGSFRKGEDYNGFSLPRFYIN